MTTAALAAAAAAALAAALLPRPPLDRIRPARTALTRGRTPRATTPSATAPSATAPSATTPRATALAVAAAATAAWVLTGPRAGPLAALLVAAGTARALAGLPSRAAAEADRARAAAVPLLADLVAACVAAGAPVDTALDAAATAVGGPLGDDVAAATRADRLGVPPRVAWAPLLAAERPPPVRALARALTRSTDSGAPPAAVLRAVADDARAAARTAGEVAARRAGVLAVLPLGLCFLPAFVLLGVVPLVISLLTGVLG